MTKPRIFQIVGSTLSEIKPESIGSARWTDSLSNQPKATIQLLRSIDLNPANAPEKLIIVPSQREDLEVPAYGPYEVTSYGWNGEGYGLEAMIGVDFASRFATAGTAILNSIIGQVRGFSNGEYQPFADWATTPSPSDSPNVAKLGLDAIANLVTASLYNVSNLSDLESLLARFGLSAYLLIEWPVSGWMSVERLAVWPLHPLVKTVNSQDQYSVQPRISVVSGWSNDLPLNFVSPNVAMPNEVSLPDDFRNIEYFPNLVCPDAFNFPDGTTKPSYRTRQINIGYRLLGVEQDITFYHTGTRPPVIYRTPQVVTTGGSSKLTEEVERWALQNSAANLTVKRFVGDGWNTLTAQFFVPHQIIKIPERIFPVGWDTTNHSDFVIREVTHHFSAEAGYSQEIAATLWQGPFERLVAVDD